jgi:phenolic acid decarboxylase
VRFSFVLFIALILAMTGFSCKEKGGKNISQGEIHYNIDYIGSFGPMPKEVLPKNLIVSFKDNKIIFEMISSFGNSGILNLSNPEKGIVDTYFSLFTLKYFYAVQPGEQFPGFEAMKDIVIKKTGRTSVICGFNCKNAEVTIPSLGNKVYQIWYTNEISVKNPNTATPFSQIDGVLMSFFFFLGPAELHFDAETVYKKDIPDEIFERRDKFMRVSRAEIDKFINKMISL